MMTQTKQPRIPDPQTYDRLLKNLRRTRLEMAEWNLQLAEVEARLEMDLRQQRRRRVQKSLDRLEKS